ncbi:hypothetical protein C7S18_04450 [Ahniella affigens]|uniref:TIR domain-containing protein n=1 Tax=Ahniella affigens TaxID=2021234 RepID=A0A2P1PNR7_9GAMM|nr:TIR domain-containing protein [Ahniella affigens]AVP96492.1 hypothetical protein C7S18_04450 [Ahniella affigens]
MKLLSQSFIALALDPIHIGDGLYRRDYDETRVSRKRGIARDVDGLPIIPVSSLKGCVRSLISADYGVAGCDGKGWNCPQPHRCASCAIFGYANYHSTGSSSSLVRFSSATLVAVPIRTPTGVVLVSSGTRLAGAGIAPKDCLRHGGWECTDSVKPSELEFVCGLVSRFEEPPSCFRGSIEGVLWDFHPDLRDATNKLISLDEASFQSLAKQASGRSSSVAIGGGSEIPKPGALFETEYILRSSILAFEVSYFDPEFRGIPEFGSTKSAEYPSLSADLGSMAAIVGHGLRKLEDHGIGGRKGRGYGRLRVLSTAPEAGIASPCINSAKVNGVSRVADKVMISYESKDRVVARRLAADMQNRRFDVWLDEHEIHIGDNVLGEVNRALDQCDFMVVLLSETSLKSRWVEHEINVIQTREIRSASRILLPVLVRSQQPLALPAALSSRRSADLSRYNEALESIIRAIHFHRGRRSDVRSLADTHEFRNF